jgi:hypothetical protein
MTSLLCLLCLFVAKEGNTMTDLLKFTVQSLTENELAIKVKNTSGATLDKTLVIQLFSPSYLVSDELSDVANEAAKSVKPPGSKTIKGIATGPEGWSIWVRPETSNSSVIIVLINDLDENVKEITPAKVPTDAEFTIKIPLDPTANRANVNLLYSYQLGRDPKDLPVTGSLELRPEKIDWTPEVTLSTDHASPTAVPAGGFVKISWSITNGVSAVLRGPLPGGNSELTLSSATDSNFKISGGSFRVAVVSSMIYMLQAEVKGPDGQPNVQVVRMLVLDAANKKHLYISPRPDKVLPYGLIEIDWAAWGVKDVSISVSGHTNRDIPLTEQTLGRFFEGSGVMRVSASHTINKVKTTSETLKISSSGNPPKEKRVDVISWMSMDNPNVKGNLVGLAVNTPKIALLTSEGLHIAHVYDVDPSPPLQQLTFKQKTTSDTPSEWLALTALDTNFVTLYRKGSDLIVGAYNRDEKSPDNFLPLTLPGDFRVLLDNPKVRMDLVGAGKRAYVVVECPASHGTIRRAYSAEFNSDTKKSSYRQEKLLEPLNGYRLAAFDGALYAFNRITGRMFRFGINTAKDELEAPRQAASAVRINQDGIPESMIREGLIVPVGRILVVLSPSSFPSVSSLEPYGLKNTLSYTQDAVSDQIPQDLFYNPQKDYWGRCGHDLDIQTGAVAAYRGGASKRLWVVQPNRELLTLAVGNEQLFAHDYRPEYPTNALAPYLTRERMFQFKTEPLRTGPINEEYRRLGVTEFDSTQPGDPPSRPGGRGEVLFAVSLKYNEADPGMIRVRRQVQRTQTQRPDVDYLLEVVFEGADLSTVTTCYRRLSLVQGQLTEDEVHGSRLTTKSTTGIIEVSRPRRFEERYRLVVVNASQNFRIKQQGLRIDPYILDDVTILIDHEIPNFSLQFEGKIATQGVIQVSLNFALRDGIEASRSTDSQTKLIRLITDKAEKIQIVLLKMLNPGDPTLTLPGIKPIESKPNQPVYVCQLDYKM